MSTDRTNLQDELAALIAAGRELTPEHDRALAEVFIERMAGRNTAPTRPAPTRVLLTPRRIAAAVLLGLACLTGRGLAIHQTARSVTDQAHAAPMFGKQPAMPIAPKMAKPIAPKPAIPIAPKGPVAPQVAVPKPAP